MRAHVWGQTAEAEEDEDWLGIQEAKAARKKQLEEDAAQGLATEGEGGEEEGADMTGAKALSRKGYASAKKRKVAPSKKSSPAKKAVAAKKKK